MMANLPTRTAVLVVLGFLGELEDLSTIYYIISWA